MYTVNWIVFEELHSKSFADKRAARDLALALIALGVSYVIVEGC